MDREKSTSTKEAQVESSFKRSGHKGSQRLLAMLGLFLVVNGSDTAYFSPTFKNPTWFKPADEIYLNPQRELIGPRENWHLPAREEIESLPMRESMPSLSGEESKQIISSSGVKLIQNRSEISQMPYDSLSPVTSIFLGEAGDANLRQLTDSELSIIAQALRKIPYAEILAPTIIPYQIERKPQSTFLLNPNYVVTASYLSVPRPGTNELLLHGIKNSIISLGIARDFSPDQEYKDFCQGIQKVYTEAEWLEYALLHEYGHGLLDKMAVGLLPKGAASPYGHRGFSPVFDYDVAQTAIYKRFAELDGWQFVTKGEGRPLPVHPKSFLVGGRAFPSSSGIPMDTVDKFDRVCFTYSLPAAGWMRDPFNYQKAPTGYALYDNLDEAFAESYAVYRLAPSLLSSNVYKLMDFLHRGLSSFGADFISLIRSNPDLLTTY